MPEITCIGEILIDFIGKERQSLKDNDQFSKRAGGAPANVAVAASRLGADVELAASVGSDEFGEFLIERMDEKGVKTERIFKREGKTTLAFASLDSESRPHFSFYREADKYITEKQLEDIDSDIIHLGSLPLTSKKTAERILDFLETTDKAVSFDPNLREDLIDLYGKRLKTVVDHTDILFIAEEELGFFGGIEELRSKVEKLVVTKGSEGAEAHIKGEKIRVEARDVDVVDTTGAGDALCGAFLAFHDKGDREALEKAVEAATISVTEVGAMSALPDRDDLIGTE